MEGDDGAECLVNCCCRLCNVCTQVCLEACIETECCGAAESTTRCAVVGILSVAAITTLVVLLVVAFAVVVHVRVTVEEAYLGRLALADGDGAAVNNGTAAIAYDVSLAVAVRNRNFAVGVWRTAALDAELRFRGQTFSRARLAGAEWGHIATLGKAVYRVAAMADRTAPVALGSDGVAEFLRERDAGVFELELAVVGEVKYEGHRNRRNVRATCPLKLALSTATALAAFTRVECT